jgi:hypothetical protein
MYSLGIYNYKTIITQVLEVLDSLMGCDLGNICAKRSDKPVKNPTLIYHHLSTILIG